MNTLGVRLKSVVTLAIAITVMLCPVSTLADFVFSDFSSVSSLNLQGWTGQSGNMLRLTPSEQWVRGSAWYTEKQSVEHGFETTLSFQITSLGIGGADGLAFVVQNSSDSALGNIGGWIGYAGIPNSIVIEFDTWDNFECICLAGQSAFLAMKKPFSCMKRTN